jgi:hypothetical protein
MHEFLQEKMRYIFYILILSLLLSCDEGIGPEGSADPRGFSGTITFIGDWPEGIARTHIVLFLNPLNGANDFNVFNLKYVSQEIPNGTAEFNYNTTEGAFIPDEGFIDPGTYSYLAVAQSETADLSLDIADWTVAGVYYAAGDSTNPGVVTITNGVVSENINIICDFNNPPPQPPGGI